MKGMFSMELQKISENGVLNITITGRVDTTTAPLLESELKGDFDSCEQMILDFTNVEYISSAGLRVLLYAHKTMARKGGLTVRNADEDIMEIFEVTGFASFLNIE